MLSKSPPHLFMDTPTLFRFIREHSIQHRAFYGCLNLVVCCCLFEIRLWGCLCFVWGINNPLNVSTKTKASRGLCQVNSTRNFKTYILKEAKTAAKFTQPVCEIWGTALIPQNKFEPKCPDERGPDPQRVEHFLLLLFFCDNRKHVISNASALQVVALIIYKIQC